MTGTANTQEEVNKAVAIARDTEGVKSVNSKLTVQKDR
jgi:osmotically-inducible protein OsmY